MLKYIFLYPCLVICLTSCSDSNLDKIASSENLNFDSSAVISLAFDLQQANKLVQLPLSCVGVEYPNKLGQTLSDITELGEPSELHPAFYGCFDWHSSVHGHWSMVYLAKNFPDLEMRDSLMTVLLTSISRENIVQERKYFERPRESLFERTYGWTWLLKLAYELETWDVSEARELSSNLKPLTDMIVKNYLEFIPKLQYPLRSGTHGNLAFGLTFAYDYAIEIENDSLKLVIEDAVERFYLNDIDGPLEWEPNGYDFLSPCLEEINLVARVLPENEFNKWIDQFLPEITNSNFSMSQGIVGDREDGLLVHLDGLNFSRSWCMYYLASKNKRFGHLVKLADEHVSYSLPNLLGDSYEGGHWLGSFAILALDSRHQAIQNKF